MKRPGVVTSDTGLEIDNATLSFSKTAGCAAIIVASNDQLTSLALRRDLWAVLVHATLLAAGAHAPASSIWPYRRSGSEIDAPARGRSCDAAHALGSIGVDMSAAKLLDRLDRVKQTGPGRWIARCPAHQDKSPSLSVRELDDGRVLVKDFGGCSTDDVLGALGLSMADLFPPLLTRRGKDSSERWRADPASSQIPARDLLVILDHELTVAVLILHDVTQRRMVNEGQVGRLVQAAARVGKARDMANPARVDRHAA